MVSQPGACSVSPWVSALPAAPYRSGHEVLHSSGSRTSFTVRQTQCRRGDARRARRRPRAHPAAPRRSITFDQGSEWGCWETIAATYGIDVWFCDPHSPWQRGQVENLHRQWRFWFPRGTDLASVAPAHVDHVASIVNGQRRRSLGYQSPTALYAAAAVQ